MLAPSAFTEARPRPVSSATFSYALSEVRTSKIRVYSFGCFPYSVPKRAWRPGQRRLGSVERVCTICQSFPLLAVSRRTRRLGGVVEGDQHVGVGPDGVVGALGKAANAKLERRRRVLARRVEHRSRALRVRGPARDDDI